MLVIHSSQDEIDENNKDMLLLRSKKVIEELEFNIQSEKHSND